MFSMACRLRESICKTTPIVKLLKKMTNKRNWSRIRDVFANFSRFSRILPTGQSLLKRNLLIFSARIFDSRVDRAIPSLAAAPDGPNIRPWDSRRASSIISRSVDATFSERKRWSLDLVSSGVWDSHLSSTVKISVSHTITDRSITFCNSRMLPGQGYDWSNCRVFLSTFRMLLPALRA